MALSDRDLPALAPATAVGELRQSFPRADGATQELNFSLHWYWLQIRRQWRKIAAAVLPITALATLIVVRMPKQYEATATVRIDAEDRVANAADATQGGTEAPNYETLIVTEMDEAKSRSVILEAVHNGKLDLDPAFQAQVNEAAVRVHPGKDLGDDDYFNQISNSLTVERPGSTRTIVLHVRNGDANIAALVANTLAMALINHEYETRLAAMSNASQFMSRQLDDLRANVEKTGKALVDYERSSNILNPDDRENVMNQRLLQLGAGLTTAQSERIKAATDLAAVQSGDPAAVLATDNGQFLRPAYQSWQQARENFQRVQAEVGANNPQYQQAQAQSQSALQVLQLAEQQLAAQVQVNYQRAEDRERLMQQAVGQARQEMDAYNARAVEYGLLKRDAESAQTIYQNLEERVKENDVMAGFRSRNLRVTDPAVAIWAPVAPRVKLTVAATFTLALLLSCGFVILVGMADRGITEPEEVEELLGVRFLGALPAVANSEVLKALLREDPVAHSESRGRRHTAFIEAIWTLRSAILFAAVPDMRVLSVVSATASEGKSTAAVNLAAAFARHGARVLLVDADIRRPSVHRLFGVRNTTGLTTLLEHQASIEEAVVPSGTPGLDLLTAGQAVPSPAELLSRNLDELLLQLRGNYDLLVVDTPPLLGFVDALHVSSQVDGVVLVTRAGKIPREQVRFAIRQLRQVRAPLLGVVLNQVSANFGSYYAANYYAEYYLSEKEDSSDAVEPEPASRKR